MFSVYQPRIYEAIVADPPDPKPDPEPQEKVKSPRPEEPWRLWSGRKEI